MLSQERGRQTIEATINARGFIFRAEETENDIYDAIDRVVEKLSTQMSRFKGKIQKKNKIELEQKNLSLCLKKK